MDNTINLEGTRFSYINFDIDTNKVISVLGDEEYSETLENMEICDRYLFPLDMTIIGIPDDDLDDDDNEPAQEEVIGYLRGVYIPLLELDYPLFDVCDAYDASLSHFAAAIVDRSGDVSPSVCMPDTNILYIDRLFIEPEYRGRGIGQFVIQNLTDMVNQASMLVVDMVFLEPVPQERDEDGQVGEYEGDDVAQRKERLTQFYAGLGYNFVRGTKYMFSRQ